MNLTVAQLVGLLLQIEDQTLPVRVLEDDGVAEFEFCAPILTLENSRTDSAFVAINVMVE